MHLRGWVLALALAVSGCASLDHDPRLVRGRSRSTEVIALYGAPVRSWVDADGSKTLEYSRQPWGTQCLMVRLDADDRLTGIEDVLLPQGRARIQPGQTPEQVSRLLGRERSRVRYALSGEEVWDWNIAPDTPGYGLRFNVHFKDGRVVRTTQSMVFYDRRHGLMDD